MGTHHWARWFLLWAFIFHQAELTVFLSANDAHKVIARSKRASFIILEEILQGNLERECLEERCTYEEAREVFENKKETDTFWNGYFGGIRCSSSPCLHNGVCKDTIRSYTCSCIDGFVGNDCASAKNECSHEMNEGCQHFCYPGLKSYRCSCAQGYELGQDDKSCIPKDQCACGRFYDYAPLELDATEKIHRGFPWQVFRKRGIVNVEYNFTLGWLKQVGFLNTVLLLNAEGKELCGGVLLQTNFVLTTAECALQSPISAVIGNNRLQGARQIIEVKHVNEHILYDSSTGENNLVLLELTMHIDCNRYQLPICIPERDFAEHVLISELVATLSGWKMDGNQSIDSLTRLHVSYLHEDECKQALNRSLITRQFCGYSNETVGEVLAGGSFSAVDYKGTWFLTGVLEPWATEVNKWKTFIFTKTSRYTMWFKRTME